MLASARPCHQPMRRNDIIPTPSHPTNRRSMLLAMVSVSMAIRKIRRKVKNFVMYGSEFMYHEANSRMDHVTNSAMGKNNMEYRSIFRVRGILKFWMNCHSQ